MSIQKQLWSVVVLLALATVVYAIGLKETPTASVLPRTGEPEAPVGIANPASTNCVETLGGTLEIRNEVNGQAGYCHLKDGRVCEEWALFRDSSCVSPM